MSRIAKVLKRDLLCLEKRAEETPAIVELHRYSLETILTYVNIFGRFQTACRWVKTHNKYPIATTWKAFWGGWKYYVKYELHDKHLEKSIARSLSIGSQLTVSELANPVKTIPLDFQEVMAQLYRLAKSNDDQIDLD